MKEVSCSRHGRQFSPDCQLSSLGNSLKMNQDDKTKMQVTSQHAPVTSQSRIEEFECDENGQLNAKRKTEIKIL